MNEYIVYSIEFNRVLMFGLNPPDHRVNCIIKDDLQYKNKIQGVVLINIGTTIKVFEYYNQKAFVVQMNKK